MIGLLVPMTRRISKSRSLFAPLAENFVKRISSADIRHRKKLVKYGCWLLFLMIGYSFMSGTYGLPRIIRLELEQSRLEESNRILTAELIDAVRIRDMLRYDPDYIEGIARTRYYMVYPGETVYRNRGH